MVANNSVLDPGFHAVVGSMPLGGLKPFVFHPSHRSENMLADILHLAEPNTELVRFRTGQAAQLLYNLDFFQTADLSMQYFDLWEFVNSIYSEPKQAMIFMKKLLSVISKTALDVEFYKQKNLIQDDYLKDFASFDMYWNKSLKISFASNIDDNEIYSQYHRLVKHVDKFENLVKTSVYFTAKKWTEIDLGNSPMIGIS